MMMKSGARWVLVGSLVSILMMGGLGLGMGKKPAKSEETTPVEKSQKKVQPETTGEIKESPATVKDKRSQVGTEVTSGPAKVEELKAGERRLIMEYKFDEEVVDVIFGEVEMTVAEAKKRGIKGLAPKKVTEKVKVQYPKVAMIKDESIKKGEPLVRSIKFFDEEGKLKKEIPVQRYIPGKQRPAAIDISENRRYICVTTVKREAEKEEINEAESQILNTEGILLWETKHFLSYTKVSSNGEYVIGSQVSWGGAPLQIFYSNGLIKEIKKDNQVWGVRFSKDGSFFALSVTTIDWKMSAEKHRDRYRKHLIVLDDKGNELWRKSNIAQGHSASWSELTAITDDNIIIFTVYQPTLKVYYFDKEGNLIKQESEAKEE